MPILYEANLSSSEIDDTKIANDKTWSSEKIDEELDFKADTSSTYTKDEINNLINAKPSINDTTASTTSVYSSDKTNSLINNMVTSDLSGLNIRWSGEQTDFSWAPVWAPSDTSGHLINGISKNNLRKQMTTITEGQNILLRPANQQYTSGIGYDTSGNECIALWAKNSVTRLRWNAGVDMSTLTAGKMMNITPDFEVSKADGAAKGYIAGKRIITGTLDGTILRLNI